MRQDDDYRDDYAHLEPYHKLATPTTENASFSHTWDTRGSATTTLHSIRTQPRKQPWGPTGAPGAQENVLGLPSGTVLSPSSASEEVAIDAVGASHCTLPVRLCS